MRPRVYHDFRFVTKGIGTTEVFMDGKRVYGVTAAKIEYEPQSVPLVTLTMTAGEIQVTSDVASEVHDDG